jgi:8-oxo-dGTP diphosphatase
MTEQTYNMDTHFRPALTVDIILFTVSDMENDNYRKLPEKALQVLLMKRPEEPHEGKWALPGTFVKEDERFKYAVNRCLKYKANIENAYLEQLYTWGNPNRDPRTRVISASYMGLIDHTKVDLKPGLNIKEVDWFNIKLETIKETNKEYATGYSKIF